MRTMERFLDLAGAVFTALAASGLAVMIVINTINIVMRPIFGFSFDFVFPWTLVLFIWASFLALYPLIRSQRDVVVDVIAVRLPRQIRLMVALAADVLGIVLFGMIVSAAPTVIELQLGSMDMIPLPMFIQSLPLFFSASLIVLHLGAHGVGLITGDKVPFDHSHDNAPVQEGAPE